MIQIRILHVYAHLMFRALIKGVTTEFERLGLNVDVLYSNKVMWDILCVHLCFYELDLIG